MFLAEAPVRLDTILNADWRKKLISAPTRRRQTAHKPSKRRAARIVRQAVAEAVMNP
jgi:hypothetical protein